MIFPEHVEIINPERMNEIRMVQDEEYGSSAVCHQKIKVLQRQTEISELQMPQPPEQNGLVLSPKELVTQVPGDLHPHHHLIHTRMTHLVGAFSARAQIFLSKLQRPPTPTQSSTSSFNSSNAVSVQSLRPKAQSFGTVQPSAVSSCTDCVTCTKALDPQSRAYLCWLVLVSLCFMYNCWAIPLRSSFPKETLTIWDSSLKWSAMRKPTPLGQPAWSTAEVELKAQTFGKPLEERMPSLPNVGHSSEDGGTLSVGSESPFLEERGSVHLRHGSHSKESSEKGFVMNGAPRAAAVHSEPPSLAPVTSSPWPSVNSSSSTGSNGNLLTPTWLTLDIIADVIYLLDVVFVQPRVSFLTEHGIWAREIRTTFHSYSKRKRSKLDIISLLPLDTVFYFVDNGKDHAYLRLPRFLKAGTFWEMCERLDVALASPHVVRIARTVASMLYLVHLHACAYYLFSTWEGIASNGWVFSGRGNAYIRCFYFATKTATSIGKNPKPVNEAEYLFMTWSWLSGVFVFALLIGQIRDIVATASKTRSEFQRLLDETIHYMRRIHLPEGAQKRVFQWLTHTWEHQQVLDEQEVLEWLPSKLRGDVALDVHEVSLSKVHLFRHCGQQLLRQLVLKLRPVLYLPGDYICRKGEVGKEMYIIKAGIVEVVGQKKAANGSEESEVLATLTEGSVFGEISLLDIGGGNKRTADVRSKGFSTLFVLSKADLKEALEHHPEAKQVLKEKASQLIRENADRENKMKREAKEEDVIIIKPDPNRPLTPKLIDTVIQAVGTKSKAAQLLIYGSKAANWVSIDSTSGHANEVTNDTDASKELEGNCIQPAESRETWGHSACNQVPYIDEVARPIRYEVNTPGSNEIAENGSSVAWSSRGERISSITNGRNKFNSKKNGPRNVFEGDVTVHQRMG
ncbi:cyclic nucleotide-gated cation channel beta-3 [Ischnura elegans]|uniref:cyclic nucleotide-gated cation channel beta-3 n=1 Tax=Ischnura elegans TaxID=197161 RepID=UPI001ED8B2F5|nr:cyclic nucleotide-gated cation channel beta-3 [Ischnura elegans]